VLDQHRRGETGKLSPFEDGGGDVGSEVGEAENLAVLGSVQFLTLGQIGKLDRSAAQQAFVEPVGFDNRLDQAGVGFRRRRERICVLDHHPDFLAGASQPHRMSERQGGLILDQIRVGRARHSCRKM
jgi:hypothetical protein